MYGKFEVQLHMFLNFAQHERKWLEKNPQYLLERRLNGSQSKSGNSGKETNPCQYRKSNPPCLTCNPVTKQFPFHLKNLCNCIVLPSIRDFKHVSFKLDIPLNETDILLYKGPTLIKW
jgi:hypothetical protein